MKEGSLWLHIEYEYGTQTSRTCPFLDEAKTAGAADVGLMDLTYAYTPCSTRSKMQSCGGHLYKLLGMSHSGRTKDSDTAGHSGGCTCFINE